MRGRSRQMLVGRPHRAAPWRSSRRSRRRCTDVPPERRPVGPFYARIASDEALAWAAKGAGRILAVPTVFEDLIKTICTTNCAWSATIRMTQALCELGGGAFPKPALLAAATASAGSQNRPGWDTAVPYVQAIARAIR